MGMSVRANHRMHRYLSCNLMLSGHQIRQKSTFGDSTASHLMCSQVSPPSAHALRAITLIVEYIQHFFLLIRSLFGTALLILSFISLSHKSNYNLITISIVCLKLVSTLPLPHPFITIFNIHLFIHFFGQNY